MINKKPTCAFCDCVRVCAESISRCAKSTCLVSAEEENRMNSFNSVYPLLSVQVLLIILAPLA